MRIKRKKKEPRLSIYAEKCEHWNQDSLGQDYRHHVSAKDIIARVEWIMRVASDRVERTNDVAVEGNEAPQVEEALI